MQILVRPNAIEQDAGDFQFPAIHHHSGAYVSAIASADTPPTGEGLFFTKPDRKPYFKDDLGTEYDLTQMGVGGGGAGVMVWDDGVPIGTGTVLNARTNIRATISGSVVALDIELPATGTIVAADEGAVLGSVPILNFRGAGVQASISGSYLDIAIPGGGSGFDLYDEGGLLGAVTALDVAGALVAASVSGSRGLVAMAPTFRSMNFIVGNGSDVIASGTKGLVRTGFKGSIKGWYAASARAVTGTMSFNILKAPYAGLHTGLASIVASAPPYISGSVKGLNTGTLAGWSTDFEAGDFLEVLANGGVSNLKLVTLTLDAEVIGP